MCINSGSGTGEILQIDTIIGIGVIGNIHFIGQFRPLLVDTPQSEEIGPGICRVRDGIFLLAGIYHQLKDEQ
jgi:hypothetical protein